MIATARHAPQQSEHQEPYEPGQRIADGETEPHLGAVKQDRPDEYGDVVRKERQKRETKHAGDSVLASAEERISDVTAVELSPGEQVDHRDQKACPPGE